MIIFYGKLGARFSFPDSPKYDNPTFFRWEPVETLGLLADRYPDDQFVVVAPHDGVVEGWKPNVSSYFETHDIKNAGKSFWEHWISAPTHPDRWVMWLGVNAVSSPIPKLDGSGPVKPLQSDMSLTQPYVKAINCWEDAAPMERRVRWLWPEIRYHLKTRDLKWTPANILGQFDMVNNMKLHRYGDTRDPGEFNSAAVWHDDLNWQCQVQYEYGGLETPLVAAREPSSVPRPDRGAVIVANDIPKYPLRRETVQWASNNGLDVLGTWKEDPEWNNPVPNSELQSTLAGYTAGLLPGLVPKRANATQKFWEYVMADVMPVASPGYDSQCHLPFPEWARPETWGDTNTAMSVATQFRLSDSYRPWRNEVLKDLRDRASKCLSLIHAAPKVPQL